MHQSIESQAISQADAREVGGPPVRLLKLAAASAPFHVDQLTLGVGASVGIAFWQVADTDGRELIERADAMLYHPKQAGRGRRACAGPLH